MTIIMTIIIMTIIVGLDLLAVSAAAVRAFGVRQVVERPHPANPGLAAVCADHVGQGALHPLYIFRPCSVGVRRSSGCVVQPDPQKTGLFGGLLIR